MHEQGLLAFPMSVHTPWCQQCLCHGLECHRGPHTDLLPRPHHLDIPGSFRTGAPRFHERLAARPGGQGRRRAAPESEVGGIPPPPQQGTLRSAPPAARRPHCSAWLAKRGSLALGTLPAPVTLTQTVWFLHLQSLPFLQCTPAQPHLQDVRSGSCCHPSAHRQLTRLLIVTVPVIQVLMVFIQSSRLSPEQGLFSFISSRRALSFISFC